MKNKTAFTLAETMIVIVVLGIIATLTIPALVNKNKESVAKTKLRKAMAAYESAINKMIIENDLKSDTALTEWGNITNCTNSTNYFKKSKDINGCIFKTSDGVWWNISDIERPVISFKEINTNNAEEIATKANNENDYSAFVLVGRFGNDGSLRVDDLAYETSNNTDNSKAQVEKLYSLLGMKITDNANNTCADWNIYCKLQRGDYSNYPECNGEYRACYTYDEWDEWIDNGDLSDGGFERIKTRYFYYDENGNSLGEFSIDNNGHSGCWELPLNDGSGRTISQNVYDDGSPEYEYLTTQSGGYVEMHFYKGIENGFGDVVIDGGINGEYDGVNVFFSRDGKSCEGETQGYTCEQIRQAIINYRNEIGL